MEHNKLEVDVPGKFSLTEEAILDHLYEHPDGNLGTPDLVRILKPEQDGIKQQQQAFEEIQYGIETLVAARLVRGKRTSESESLRYVQLRLTAKGQAEAIKQRRRLKKIILDTNISWANRAK
jgi:hypothetical protein